MTPRPAVALGEAAAVPTDDAWLGPRERAALARLTRPHRRRDWRLGRYVAHQLLGSEVEVLAAEDGAPEAYHRGGGRCALTLSISHRAGLGACAVAPAGIALGCDLEWIEPRSAAFVADFFLPSEAAWVARTPEAERPQLANLVWSAKEATLKALRQGLRRDTRSVEVTVAGPPADGWGPLQVEDRSGDLRFDGWWRTHGGWILTVIGAPALGRPEEKRSDRRDPAAP